MKDLRDAGLTAVNISLDTLVESKYGSVTRRNGKILRTLEGHAGQRSCTTSRQLERVLYPYRPRVDSD